MICSARFVCQQTTAVAVAGAALPLSFAGMVLETDWPFFSLVDARLLQVATAESVVFAHMRILLASMCHSMPWIKRTAHSEESHARLMCLA